MNTIPKPNGEFKQTGGTWSLKPNMTAALNGFNPNCLDAFTERTGTRFNNSGDADITLINDNSLGSEEYTLEVTPELVVIKANSESGVILALTTLYSGLTPDGSPCYTLNDAPKYAYRGLLLDCVRHFFSAAEVKKVIEQISLAKLNKLHWHLTDDQGWRIESKAYPALHEGIPHYTQNEIKEIVCFAKARNVEIIPEIDMPGHMASAVHTLPWLSCEGKEVKRPVSGGMYKAILCAGKESTFEFVFKVLDEVTELFESSKIHIGGDEAPKKKWEECVDCKRRMEETGSANFEDLQGYFTGRIAEYLSSKDKEIICWNETLRAEKLPGGLTVQYWMPGQDDEKATAFVNGSSVVFSDMFKLYLDYPHAMIPLKKVYDYTPSIRGADCENTAGTIGLEVCLWSERVETEKRLEEQIFPRVFALAEVAWSRSKDYEDFKLRLAVKLEELKKLGIYYTSDYDPSSKDSKAELMAFVSGFSVSGDEPDDNQVDLNEIFSGDTAVMFLQGFGIDPAMLAQFG